MDRSISHFITSSLRPSSNGAFILLLLGLSSPTSALGWCISKNACSVASVCDYVMEGKITYLNVPVFLLVIYTIPLLFLLYHLWWKIITKFRKALTGTLAFERQLLPIYIRWLQILMLFMVWLIVSLFLAPINSILAIVLTVVEIFGLSMFCNTLIIWMHMPDLSRRSLLKSIVGSIFIAGLVASGWYFIANPGSEWTSTNTDWSFFGILYNGVWFLIYLTLLVVPYVPYLRTFAARRALQRFLFVLVAVWLMSTATAVLRYLGIDGASCVAMAQSALSSLFFVIVYVSALSADSIEWRKKGYAGTKFGNNSSTLPLLTLSDDWRIDYDDLEIVEPLARGNFAEVHRGFWRGINVAIKTLYQTQMQHTELKQFENEVELLRQLHHPNIVLFIGACMQAPHFSIVMEFMTQGSLYHVIHSDREITLHRKFLMGRDIARGMLYLHSHKPSIVHRDLKSLNILVDDSLNLKVTDFGLSCKVNHTITAVGTPMYSAPEVLRSSVYTEKSDVYSFGIIMWELMTREEPYVGINLFEIINKVVTEKLRPRLPAPSDEFPSCLLDIIQRCWDDEPEVRPCFREILEYMEIKAEETRDPALVAASSCYVDLSSSGVRRTLTAGLRRSSSLSTSAGATTSAASSMPLPSLAAGAGREESVDDEDRRRTTTGSGEESGDGGPSSVRLQIDVPASWDDGASDAESRERTREEEVRRQRHQRHEQERSRQLQQQLQRQRQQDEREDNEERRGDDEDEDEDSRTRRRLNINDADNP